MANSSDASSTEGGNEDTQISIACRQYEISYDLPPGSCTALQVQRSSAGIQGWSEADLTQESGQQQGVITEDDASYQEGEDIVNPSPCHIQDIGPAIPCPPSVPASRDTWNNDFIHITKQLPWKQCQKFSVGRTRIQSETVSWQRTVWGQHRRTSATGTREQCDLYLNGPGSFLPGAERPRTIESPTLYVGLHGGEWWLPSWQKELQKSTRD